MAGAEPMVADLRAESDELDALVAELPESALGRAHPCAGMDHRPSDRAPPVDRPRRTDSRHRRSRLRGHARGGGEGSPRVRRRRRRGVGDHPARSAAGRLAPDPYPPARRTADRGRGPQTPVVRTADERPVDGHRPVDGDLGARPRRRRHPRASTGPPPRGCVRSHTSGCAPATSPSLSTALRHRQIRSSSSSVRRTARRGHGVPTTPHSGSPARHWISACWSRSGGHGLRWT